MPFFLRFFIHLFVTELSKSRNKAFDKCSPLFIYTWSAQRSGDHSAPTGDSALGMRYYAELIAL